MQMGPEVVAGGSYSAAAFKDAALPAGRLVPRMTWPAVMIAGTSTGNSTRTSIAVRAKRASIMICSHFSAGRNVGIGCGT